VGESRENQVSALVRCREFGAEMCEVGVKRRTNQSMGNEGKAKLVKAKKEQGAKNNTNDQVRISIWLAKCREEEKSLSMFVDVENID